MEIAKPPWGVEQLQLRACDRPRDSKAFRASLREWGVELCELAVELKQTALLQHTAYIIFNKSCSLWLHIRAACCDILQIIGLVWTNSMLFSRVEQRNQLRFNVGASCCAISQGHTKSSWIRIISLLKGLYPIDSSDLFTWPYKSSVPILRSSGACVHESAVSYLDHMDSLIRCLCDSAGNYLCDSLKLIFC